MLSFLENYGRRDPYSVTVTAYEARRNRRIWMGMLAVWGALFLFQIGSAIHAHSFDRMVSRFGAWAPAMWLVTCSLNLWTSTRQLREATRREAADAAEAL